MFLHIVLIKVYSLREGRELGEQEVRQGGGCGVRGWRERGGIKELRGLWKALMSKLKGNVIIACEGDMKRIKHEGN